MFLRLKIINSDATLNTFFEVGTAQIVPGSDAIIRMQLIQPQKNDLRYIPKASATFEIDLLKSDGTTLTKSLTQPFSASPEDRSILELVLDETETANLITQNLNVKVTEGSDISFAVVQTGMQIVPLNTQC